MKRIVTGLIVLMTLQALRTRRRAFRHYQGRFGTRASPA